MLEKFKSIVNNDFDGFQGKELYLAISGGQDSICLSQLLLASGYKHTLLHCNFQLRGVESDLDQEFIEDYAKLNQLPLHVKKFNTSLIAMEKKLTIQETARNLRYDWFQIFLTTSDKLLLTAHHANDAIETFFINLMRGTTLQGLTGIKQQNGQIVRPLMSFTGDEIASHITTNSFKFREDKSNADIKYLRNYLRHEIIPALDKKSNNFQPKLTRTIDSLRQADSWIQKQANRFCEDNFNYDKNIIKINKDLLLQQDNIFLVYVFGRFGIRRSNVESFKAFLNGSTGTKFLSDIYEFNLDRKQIIITDSEISITENSNYIKTIQKFPLTVLQDQVKMNFSIISEPLPYSNSQYQQLNLDEINLPISVRKWKHGDRIQPLGMRGTKLISDILIDKKIPLFEKSKILILLDSTNTIIAVHNILISEKVKIQSDSTNILKFELDLL